MKRTRKPPVRPEVARQWLKRNEQDGESPPQIAQSDGYDVRTVRRQLETMRQEREVRETRQIVFRQALEKHYVDIYSFAEKLRAEISSREPSRVSRLIRDDPMWKALREHLPRSPIWASIDKLEKLADPFISTVDRIRERIKRQAVEGTSLEFVSATDKNWFD